MGEEPLNYAAGRVFVFARRTFLSGAGRYSLSDPLILSASYSILVDNVKLVFRTMDSLIQAVLRVNQYTHDMLVVPRIQTSMGQ